MAIAALPVSRALDPKQIVRLAKDRKRSYSERDQWYNKLLSYYRGDQKQAGSGDYAPPVLAMNSQGRPLLRSLETGVGSALDVKRGYNSKRLSPIVDDYMAIKGVMPSSRVIPPDAADGERKADLLTKFIYSTHELSDMGRQQPEAGFWSSMLGDAVYILSPDKVGGSGHEIGDWRVVWEVVGPHLAYPSFYRGYRKHQVFDLIVIEEWAAYDINQTFADFGIRVKDDAAPEERLVTTYISPYQRTVLVGQERPLRGPHVEWDLGFCPVAWAFNKVPGHMGMADIQHALGSQDFHDFLMSVLADGFVNATYPLVGLRGSIGEMGEDQILRGPDAPPIKLEGPDSDIIVRSTSGDIRAAMQMVSQTMEDITAGTGSSQARQTGDMKSSIVTGRAVHASQGPQSTRIDLWHQTMSQLFQHLNAMTLEMQERAPFLRDFDSDVFGNYRGRSFQVRFNARQDIDGWYRNMVKFETLVGLNQQQKVAIAYEGVSAKIWDLAYAREMVGVDDPMGMDTRIEQQMLTEARIQANVQRIMSGEGGQGGPPASPNTPPGPVAAPSSSGGSAGPSPRALMERPKQTTSPSLPPAGGPSAGPPAIPKMGVTRDQLESALAGIAATLKGEVYAVDDLAFQGATQAPKIAVTDFRDQTKVTTALRPMIPGLKVTVVESENLPTEAVKLV